MRRLRAWFRWLWPHRWACMSCCRADPVMYCVEAHRAKDAGTLVWSSIFGGWIDHSSPRRRMSEKARYFAFVDRRDYPHVDHGGEPLVWDTCPWCRGELPDLNPKPTPPVGGQADGDAEG